MSAASPRPTSLVLVGAGRMGRAMLDGWIALGTDLSGVAVLEPRPSADLRALSAERGFALNPAPHGIAPPDAVVLAIKPQILAGAAAGVAPLVGPDTLLLSILAGKTIADLRGQIPQARAIVRAMPNLAASIRRSATGAIASPETSDAQRALADRLLSGIGTVEWLGDEGLIDAVTAVSGSGPAYFFHLTECLAEAAQDIGLPPDLAERLARATIIGAGELLAQGDASPSKLREDVTSPGGTTAAALEVLMGRNELAALMRKAVAAAKRRAEELSG